jgi:hypothetical protein
MAKELDFITAMSIIEKVERSDYKGDYSFLKLALGKETFKTMAAMGYIHSGFRFKDGNVVDTYSVTKSFESWNKHLSQRKMMSKLKAMIGL